MLGDSKNPVYDTELTLRRDFEIHLRVQKSGVGILSLVFKLTYKLTHSRLHRAAQCLSIVKRKCARATRSN